MRTPRTLHEIPRRVRNARKGSTIANPDTHSPISRHSIRLCRPDVHGPLVHAAAPPVADLRQSRRIAGTLAHLGGKPQQGSQISFSPEHRLAGWSGFVSIKRDRKGSQETLSSEYRFVRRSRGRERRGRGIGRRWNYQKGPECRPRETRAIGQKSNASIPPYFAIEL